MSLKKRLISASRFNKKIIVSGTDFLCICVASLFALVISDVNLAHIDIEQFIRLLWTPVFCIIFFWLLGVYSAVVRYIDFSLIAILARAITIVFVVNIAVEFAYSFLLKAFFQDISKSLITLEGWLVGFVTFSFLIISSRLLANFYLSDRISEKRVAIYGAGSAGIQLASALRVSKEMQPVAFIDANISLQGTYLGGIKVLHPNKLRKLALREKIDEVLKDIEPLLFDGEIVNYAERIRNLRVV